MYICMFICICVARPALTLKVTETLLFPFSHVTSIPNIISLQTKEETKQNKDNKKGNCLIASPKNSTQNPGFKLNPPN